jgi:predicted DNA-binding transcriptional regulator YafY
MSEYTVTLKVHPERVNFAKWLTPGRHQIIAPSQGGDWITMRVQVESMELAKMMVFGLGRHVIVVEPSELHDAVLEAAREIMADEPHGYAEQKYSK